MQKWISEELSVVRWIKLKQWSLETETAFIVLEKSWVQVVPLTRQPRLPATYAEQTSNKSTHQTEIYKHNT